MDWIKKFVNSNTELKELMDNKLSENDIKEKLEQSPELIHNMMEAFKRNDDPIYATLMDGDAALEQYDYQKAISYYSEALTLSRKEDDEREGYCYEKIGNVYAHQILENYTLAIDKYLEEEELEYRYQEISELALCCSILFERILEYEEQRKYLQLHEKYKTLNRHFLDSL